MSPVYQKPKTSLKSMETISFKIRLMPLSSRAAAAHKSRSHPYPVLIVIQHDVQTSWKRNTTQAMKQMPWRATKFYASFPQDGYFSVCFWNITYRFPSNTLVPYSWVAYPQSNPALRNTPQGSGELPALTGAPRIRELEWAYLILRKKKIRRH